ncbi:MAG: pyrimidine-nucleoside phosphorylase [Verrucomicrobiales bacterium]|jgi:pyrimidine-nucleoside phosphorylase
MKPVVALIERKRDGFRLADDEIRGLINAYTAGDVPDYQMAALAMAICIRGMDEGETSALTAAMLASGAVLTHTDRDRFQFVDKHSTGGIGDKTSLILAPLLASAGFRVPMISGRGLGITGGTLDKLESIPGFRTDLSLLEIDQQLQSVGCVITGQTPEICPADRKLYALRDVTATVPSRPLIVSSIMSKKLAESLDSLVLDVKFGSGAFMKTMPEARLLAAEMAAVGKRMGVNVSTLLTPMDEPLGTTVGNALEVSEAVSVLSGRVEGDLRDLVLDLAESVSHRPRLTLEEQLQNGAALEKWTAMVAAQGGDSDVDPGAEHCAPYIKAVLAPADGVLVRLDAGEVGQAALELGAGRSKAGDSIDFSVGFSEITKVGTRLVRGQTILKIHASCAATAASAEDALKNKAIEIQSSTSGGEGIA